MNKNKTFNIVTFGCKVNSYESESIKESLIAKGYTFTDDKTADIKIFNTCAVTLVAEKKCLKHIKSAARNNPNCQIIVLGCYAQLHPEQIKDLPNIKVLVGSSSKGKIAEYLEEEKPVIKVQQDMRLAEFEELKINYFGSEIRAFEKIQDGCDNFCSYCIIPLTRGKSRSRKSEDILAEIHTLAVNGYKEIVITGVDMGSYKDGEINFSDLMEKILDVEPKTFRLRIGSLETSQFDEKMIQLYINHERLVPHIHIPLQSGCEKILESMGRKYDLDEFYKLVLRLKNEVKNCALSTDIIVGFPGETDEDFIQTCEFVRKVGFMRLHVFPYSPRPYTKASRMKNQIDRACSKNRVRLLVSIGEELADKYESSFVGKQLIVLVEEELKPVKGMRVFRGYTENYLDLKFKSNVDLLGKYIEVTINNEDYIENYNVLENIN
jgi:threonylcarbamoyladenosine tRNA methylthiotransferase MtaB